MLRVLAIPVGFAFVIVNSFFIVKLVPVLVSNPSRISIMVAPLISLLGGLVTVASIVLTLAQEISARRTENAHKEQSEASPAPPIPDPNN